MTFKVIIIKINKFIIDVDFLFDDDNIKVFYIMLTFISLILY